MSINPGDIALLQQAVLQTMSDTVKITRAGEPTVNETTGQETYPTPTTLHNTQQCRIGPWGGQNVVQAGEQPVSLRIYNVTLPIEIDDLQVNDSIEVLTSQDSYLVGKTLRVEDIKGVFHGVQRRVTAELNLG
jgi:hypothetical protein